MRTLVRDDFRRADVNPLAYPWSDSVGADLRLVDYGVDGTAGSDCSMIYRGVLPDDRQWAEAKIKFLSSGFFRGPLVRGSQSDWVFLDAYTTTHYAIEWYNGGSWTQIGSNSSNAPALNDVIRLEADGDRFRAYCNNVLMIEGTNSSAPSSGYCGLYVYSSHATSLLTDFACGNIDGFDHPPTEQPRFIPTAPNGGWILNRPPLDVPFELNRNSPLANGLVFWMPILQYAWGKSDIANTYSNVLVLDLIKGRRLSVYSHANQPAISFVADPKLGRILRYQNPDHSDSGQYCRWGFMPELEGIAQMSMSIWYKQFASTRNILVGWQDVDAGAESLGMEYWLDGRAYFNVSPDSGYASGYYYVGTSDLDWHNYVMVFDGTQTGNSNRLRGWVDGQPQSLLFDGTIPSVTPTAARIVTAQCGLTNSLISGSTGNGGLFDIRYWNRVLSDEEVYSIYADPWQLYAPKQPRPYYHIPTPHKTRRFSIT